MGRKAYKLTDEQVREIRVNRHGLTYQKQADKYGVHKNTIIRIRYGESRKNVY
jgi:DNA-binding XRE family transcriptional regulator